MIPRRSLLAVMGLAPVGAIAADDVTNQRDTYPYGKAGKHLAIAKYDPERLAAALEKLAAEVRAQTVLLNKFAIHTDAISQNRDDHWLTQELSIGVEFLIDPPTT